MSTRPPVPTDVQRQLWAESIGHCMNPSCLIDLIQDGKSIGEMAHIVEWANGGPPSFDNLLLLCSNCHTKVDKNRTDTTTSELHEWKAIRNREIQKHFTMRCFSFKALSALVVPILERNRQIFVSYGPEGGPTENPQRHQLWLQFENELVSNNRRLELILTSNKGLLHIDNQSIVDDFVAHSQEFIATREDQDLPRLLLFPKELLSIFGLEETRLGLVPNLSAIQNLITYLRENHRFVSLILDSDPRLVYLDNGNEKTVRLDDRYRLQQIFWTGKFYRPNKTDLRTESLVFLISWLNANGIKYNFEDISDLTTLIVNDTQRVKLCYPYMLSLADVSGMTLHQGDIVVNLYNWNGGRISRDALAYASEIGVQLFTQNEFFIFAHKNLK